MKKLFMMILTLCLVGCSGGGLSSSATGSDIKIEDINWSVTEGTQYGIKYANFIYTNNSSYDIYTIQLNYAFKDGVTDDDLKVFDEEKENSKWSDDDVKSITMQALTEEFVAAGSKSSGVALNYNGTYNPVLTMKGYELMEPSDISIAYLAGDTMYYETYNYKTQEYTAVSNKKAYSWESTTLSALMPEPKDFKVVTMGSYDDTYLYFDIYGATLDEYKNYVQQCKDKGFTESASGDDDSYTAKNSDGVELTIMYYDTGHIDVSLTTY